MLTTTPDRTIDERETATRPSTRSRWAFGRTALPTDPVARDLEKRGRRWLILSYVLCPCHLPVTLGLLALAFGGTAVGTVVVGHAGWVAIVLTTLYAAVLWRGFRRIRAAKRLAAAGVDIDCSTGTCTVPRRS